jgi:16S rRNA (guanine527-N7)-methyltransferase
MNPARIAELLAPFLRSAVLSSTELESISIYIDLLLRWNARINLTAIRDPEKIVTRHFGESLFAACHLFPHDERGAASSSQVGEANNLRPTTNDRLADLGSGAGFPGLPIKLWAPHISLTLIESNHKKAAFLREVTRALTLTNVDIVAARAESLRDSTFDVVTLRAVEHFEATLPIAVRLLVPGGHLALLIGSDQFHQARSTLPNLTWDLPKAVPLSRQRVLVIARTQ